MVYLISPEGRYAGSISGTNDQIIDQTPDGYSTTLKAPLRSTDYWDGSSWNAIGSAPAYYFEFDYPTLTWKDNRDIEAVKAEQWVKIKTQRNKAEFGGFTFQGNAYDSDQLAQGRILAAFVAGIPRVWTLADDTIVELTAEDLKDLLMALSVHIETIHSKARDARVLIEAAVTIEEVEAIQLF